MLYEVITYPARAWALFPVRIVVSPRVYDDTNDGHSAVQAEGQRLKRNQSPRGGGKEGGGGAWSPSRVLKNREKQAVQKW